MRIHLIRTYHPHWGQHTGAHQFIHYLDPERFQIDDRVVTMGDGDFPIKASVVRLGIKYMVRRKGMRVYGLNDLLAEFAAGRQWWRKEIGRPALPRGLVFSAVSAINCQQVGPSAATASDCGYLSPATRTPGAD